MHTLRSKDNGVVVSRRIRQAKHFCQTLGHFSELDWKGACDTSLDGHADGLNPGMGDVGRKILLNEHVESCFGLLPQGAVDCVVRVCHCELMPGQSVETTRDRIRIRNGSKCF